MLNLLLPVLLALAPQEAAPPPPPEAKSLSFFSETFPYQWDRLLPLTAEVDGLKVNSIFFNKRSFRTGPLKGADFGTRAQVEVTNTAKTSRIPGFAVAVFDADHRLLGVATGGAKLGSVAPGDTETFDLSFHHVLERLPLGTTFVLSVELAP